MLILHYCTYPWEKTPPFFFSFKQQRSWWYHDSGSHGFRGSSRGGPAACKFCGSSHGNGRHSIGNFDRMCSHYSISNQTKSYYWAKLGKPNYMHQVIDGKTHHNLFLRHLGMQLMVLVLMMHPLLNLVSMFNECTPHFPLLPLLHLLIQVMLHVWPINFLLGHWFQVQQNIYLANHLLFSIWFLLGTIWFLLGVPNRNPLYHFS